MKLNARIPVMAAMATLLCGATGCNQLKSRSELNKGVQAFKNKDFEVAVGDFQEAIRLDDKSEIAKLYLATAYASQVVESDKPDNVAIAQKALDSFQQVLAKDPNDLTALKQIASISRSIKRMDDAKAYERKVIAVDPNDAEAYYTIGVVDWMQAYHTAVTILAADGTATDDGFGNPKKSKGACQKMADANTAPVTEGLEALEKAVSINPNYEEAMTYLNLMYRRKADIECGNDAARKADLAQADDWTQKSMGARKANELKKEEKAGGGVTMQ